MKLCKLTEADWDRVFDVRCRSKRGLQLTGVELDLVQRAFNEDPDRYSALSSRVFEATKPAGSTR